MDPEALDPDGGLPISAYAKLEFEQFSFFIQTLTLLLGRKAKPGDNVDVHLGASKSISRNHAKIHYHFHASAWEIEVLGKNGAFVNERYVGAGETFPLHNEDKLQIAETPFTFLLPEGAAPPIDPSALAHGDFDPLMAMPVIASFQRPQASYATLIYNAITSHPNKKMTLAQIYNWICIHHPYYRYVMNGWQNSIRHNLSLNKAFMKVTRTENEPGKGAFWAV
ncbi:fork head domain-domain-containing protein, partial [Protomyces lactucae-debilis]